MATSGYIRRMNFVQMLGALVTIYRKSFVPLLLITLINVVITAVVYIVLNSGPLASEDAVALIIGLLLFIFIPALSAGPVLVAMSNTVLGNKVKVSESYRGGLTIGLLFKTFVAALPAGVVTFFAALLASTSLFSSSEFQGLGFISFLLFFFFLLFMPSWIYTPIILKLEKTAFFRSSVRGIKISFKVFGWNILIAIACMIIIGLIAALVYTSDNTAQIIYVIVAPIVTMLAVSLYVMAYYQFRVRNENYTADTLSQELGFAPLDEMMTV